MERQENMPFGLGGIPQRLERFMNLEAPGHENERIAPVSLTHRFAKSLGCMFPNRQSPALTRCDFLGMIADLYRVDAALRRENLARRQVILQAGELQRGRHHDQD